MARLIFAIISTLLEETAIMVIMLWGLPRLDINIPLPGIIAVMVAWAVYAVVTFRMGSRALRRKPILALPHMIGSRGRVVRALKPEGLVRIKGELWVARSSDGDVEEGTEVLVEGQNSLKLDVRIVAEPED
jgi:membrane-bound serine protease (ClpP class)